MELFQSLKAYKIEEYDPSPGWLADVLTQQTTGKYIIETSRFSKNVEQTDKIYTFLVKKNRCEGLLVTLHLSDADRQFALIYTVPCIPCTVMRFFYKLGLFTTFPLKFIWHNANNLDIDIRYILTNRLNAQPIDSSFI